MNKIPEEKFDEIISRLKNLERILAERIKQPSERILNSYDFLKLMDISKRTAQYWRANGIIKYVEIGNKIYYKMVDVEEMIEKNYKKKRN